MHAIESIEPIGHSSFSYLSRTGNFAVPFRCNNCKDLNIAHVGISGFEAREAFEHIREGGGAFEWYPKRLSAPDLSVLPEHIRAAAEEAHVARSVDLYRASILMARAVIEAICKDQGITGGNLDKKIDGLVEKEKILPRTRDGAHEVRLLGNKVAHGDKFEAAFVSVNDEDGRELEDADEGDFATAEISADDADDVLDLLGQIIREVYESDALEGRMKSRRERRRG